MSMESWLRLYGEGLKRGAQTWVTKNTLGKAEWNITAMDAIEELREAGIAEPVGAKGTREYFQVKPMAGAKQVATNDAALIKDLLARVARLEARVEFLEKAAKTVRSEASQAAAQGKPLAAGQDAPQAMDPDDDEEPPF